MINPSEIETMIRALNKLKQDIDLDASTYYPEASKGEWVSFNSIEGRHNIVDAYKVINEAINLVMRIQEHEEDSQNKITQATRSYRESCSLSHLSQLLSINLQQYQLNNQITKLPVYVNNFINSPMPRGLFDSQCRASTGSNGSNSPTSVTDFESASASASSSKTLVRNR